MIRSLLFVLLFCVSTSVAAQNAPFIMVLGTAQDGGYPHLGCNKQCCTKAWEEPGRRKYVVSLALADPATKKWWLFEATPDIKEQLHLFQKLTNNEYPYLPEGIFLTHAHIGHYTGLMQLGREVLNTKNVTVYALPKMKTFLENNGPWSQLVKLNNISISQMNTDTAVSLPGGITVTAFTVPHRDEYSETAGFSIHAGKRNYLFIPDIDKWSKWNRNIVDEVKKVDAALVDATFSDSTELPGRNMKEVPHPFIAETIELFSQEDAATKAKLHFIHFNHTNPVLWDENKMKQLVKAGYHYAIQGEKL